MYNRYIPEDARYEQVGRQPQRPQPGQARRERKTPPPPGGTGFLDGAAGKLGGLLRGLSLEKVDSGDILLVLILLFLFLESDDNLELVITLGLLLLFGLFGQDEEPEA